MADYSPSPQSNDIPEWARQKVAAVEAHTKQVMELAGAYMHTPSEATGQALMDLYAQTVENHQKYSAASSAYQALLATHAYILALWNVNEHFRPDDAFTYASTAVDCWKKYMDSESFLHSEDLRRDPSLLPKTQAFLEHAQLICAYICYYRDDFHGALGWLQDVDIKRTTATTLALAATVLFRLSAEENMGAFKTAYDLFVSMDRQFTQTPHFPFEEDILRAGYGFYSMYFTLPREDILGNPFPYVAYNPAQSIRILTRAYSLLTVEQQKQFLQEDIDAAKKRLKEQKKAAIEWFAEPKDDPVHEEDPADTAWLEDTDDAEDEAVQAFCMEVYDAFHIMGRGMIVSGQVISGSVQVGDTVTIVRKKTGERRAAVVRAIELGIDTKEGFSSVSTDRATTDDLVNLILPGIGKKEVSTGDKLVH